MAKRQDERRQRRARALLTRLDEQLADAAFEDARATLAELASLLGEDDPDVLFGRASLLWEERGLEHAAPLLERVVAADPTHGDALYALARVAEARGDEATMIAHHLRVHALDARADREARLGTREQLDHIEQVAYEVLRNVPSPFVERLSHVPVVLEARPSRELVREGFDPRALGLFEGPTDGDTYTPSPTRIVLFTNNLLADFVEDPELSEQVEITLLHEIGHFFNLDEDDLERLGLD